MTTAQHTHAKQLLNSLLDLGADELGDVLEKHASAGGWQRTEWLSGELDELLRLMRDHHARKAK